MNISETLIFKASQEGWIFSLCFLVKGKMMYRNSTIYNYSTRTLAEKMGCSHQKISRHIKVLKKMGFITLSGKNLRFGKIRDKHECKLNVFKRNTLKETEYKLKLKLITLKLKQSQFIIDKKREAKILEQPDIYIPLEVIKKIKRNQRKYSLETAINDDLIYSDKRLALVLGVCAKTYNKIKQWLKRENLLTYIIERVRLDQWNKETFHTFISREYVHGKHWFRSRTKYSLQ